MPRIVRALDYIQSAKEIGVKAISRNQDIESKREIFAPPCNFYQTVRISDGTNDQMTTSLCISIL